MTIEEMKLGLEQMLEERNRYHQALENIVGEFRGKYETESPQAQQTATISEWFVWRTAYDALHPEKRETK